MKSSNLVSLVAVLLFATSLCLADAGGAHYIHYNPGPVGYDEHPTIRMVGEVVTVTMEDVGADVVAEFEFKNEGPATTIEMMFPMEGILKPDKDIISKNHPDVDYYHGPALPLSDGEFDIWEFSVTVDDAADPKISYSNVEAIGTQVNGEARFYIDFAENQTRDVTIKYRTRYSDMGGMGFHKVFTYVLYTGATWKGTIGTGKIIVQPHNDFDAFRLPVIYRGVKIPPAKEIGDKIVWEFSDYEPTLDGKNNSLISVSFLPEPHPFGYYGDFGYTFAGPLIWDPHQGLNFRTKPSSDAPRVSGKPQFDRGNIAMVLKKDGDWWNVVTRDTDEETGKHYEGWVRWRYHDQDTQTDNIYWDWVTCE